MKDGCLVCAALEVVNHFLGAGREACKTNSENHAVYFFFF